MSKKTLIGVVLTMLLLSVVCFAADDKPIADGWQLGANLMELLGSVVLAGLAWLTTKAAGWIKAKTNNEALGGMLARLMESLGGLIQEAEQTLVAQLKAAKDPNSPGGTKLTASEAATIKNEVLQRFKDMWGKKGLAELAKILGFDKTGTENFIASKIDALVRKEKSGNPQ